MRLSQGLLAGAAASLALWWVYRQRHAPGFDFRGKVVLLTGGSRGLGLALARQLLAAGARLVLCARDAAELARAGIDLESGGHSPLALVCDVTNPTAVHDLVRAVTEQLGPVDVLINNAGVIQVGPLEHMTREDFAEALEVNFWGAYNTIEAVLPAMRARGSGRIVNISSFGGKVSVPHLIPYCVSKFALVGLSQGLRAELAPAGVVVTTVCPGLMRTGSPRQVHVKGRHAEEYALFKAGDSLPLLTTSAAAAAAQILGACRRGDAELVITWPARLAVVARALFPEWFDGLVALANRFMPGSAGAEGQEARMGKDLEPSLAPSWLTCLTDEAARRNNEVAPVESGGG